jgi:hypothetical protein
MKEVDISFNPPSIDAAVHARQLFPNLPVNVGDWARPQVIVMCVPYEDYITAKELMKAEGIEVNIHKGGPR